MNLRSAFVGWFGLIVLYTFATSSQGVTTVLGGVGTALQRIGDPTVPLIPTSKGGSSSAPVQTVNASPRTTQPQVLGATQIPAPSMHGN